MISRVVFLAVVAWVGICSYVVVTPAQAAEAILKTPRLPAVSSVEPLAPEGAPNILLVLLDDVGFAAASTFGGAVPTPNYDQLANQGLRFNRFHTTALCSPTRASLLTGRNHHRVGMGGLTNLAYGEPGYTSIIPKSAATLGRTLQLSGYNTAWLGKNHVTPEWEVTPTGPFERWPNGLGFDYFYGFMDGATDQFTPVLVENQRLIDPPTEENYILDRDLADHAIIWMRQQQSTSPDKPFFLYLAPGTAHVPLQAPREWITRFKGRFVEGWDVLRQQNFDRQQQMGVIPAGTTLTPRPESIPAWDSLSQKEKAVAARLMEVFAAQLAFFDEQFGRVVNEIKAQGEWQNTLVIYIDGDNGADGASGLYGTMIEKLNGAHSDVDYMHAHLEEIGGPRTFNGYPAGWAWATSSPFQYTKQIASHLGGTRDGLVISWPQRIKDRGGLRSQFLHVIDVAPTIYADIGIQPPEIVDGNRQMSLDGVSFVDTFDNPDQISPRTQQYFEMVGNRAYYQDGWIASTTPGSLPWQKKPAGLPANFKWELYNLSNDYSQSSNVADTHPQKLAELQSAFQRQAQTNQVLPLNNTMALRMRDSSLRPYVTNRRNQFEYYRTETRIPNTAFPDVKNRSWRLTMDLKVPQSRSIGTLITQGGYENGWGLFLFDGIPTFIYKTNNLPGQQWRLTTKKSLSRGKHHLELQFIPDSEQPGASARVELAIDQKAAGSVHLLSTAPNDFINDGAGIGRDFVSPLTDDYAIPFEFHGDIGPVKITLQ